jgi:hypothetical protein
VTFILTPYNALVTIKAPLCVTGIVAGTKCIVHIVEKHFHSSYSFRYRSKYGPCGAYEEKEASRKGGQTVRARAAQAVAAAVTSWDTQRALFLAELKERSDVVALVKTQQITRLVVNMRI